MSIIELPIYYFPLWCDGVYKDTFEDFYSAPVGIVCNCSSRKTIFKKISRFKQHCRGKIHKKYLSSLLTTENNPLRKLYDTEQTVKTQQRYIASLEKKLAIVKSTIKKLRKKVINFEKEKEVPVEDLLGIE